jgi:hypothetical protein
MQRFFGLGCLTVWHSADSELCCWTVIVKWSSHLAAVEDFRRRRPADWSLELPLSAWRGRSVVFCDLPLEFPGIEETGRLILESKRFEECPQIERCLKAPYPAIPVTPGTQRQNSITLVARTPAQLDLARFQGLTTPLCSVERLKEAGNGQATRRCGDSGLPVLGPS